MSIRPSARQLDRRHRGEVDLARPREPRPVPGERQPDPAGQPVAPGPQRRIRHDPGADPSTSGGVVAGAQPLELARLGCPLEDLLAGDAAAQDLAGRGRVADRVDVPSPDVERADPQRLGDPVEVGLGGELGLWRPEPAERAVGRRVRARRAGADADVRAAIRAAGVDRAPRQDDRRERAVRAAVHHDLDVLGDEPAVVGHAGPVADDRRVALGRGRQVLVAVVDHPHRTPGLARQQRRVQRDHRRVLLLATEPAAGLRLDDARLPIVDAESALERGVDVVRALERAVDGDPAICRRDRDHRVVLDVQLLLVADPVLALEDEVGGRERRVGIAGRQLVGREEGVGLERVEDGRKRFADDLRGAARRPQRRPIRGGDERERLRVVLDLATDRDQDRLVGLDRADDVVAGDVGRGDHDDRGPVEPGVELERGEPGVRIGRADRRPVPGAREHEVVGVLRGAGELGRPLATERGHPAGTTRRDGARARSRPRRAARFGWSARARAVLHGHGL